MHQFHNLKYKMQHPKCINRNVSFYYSEIAFANYELHYITQQTTLCLKKGYHPTTNDNFKSSCLIPVIFGTNIAE